MLPRATCSCMHAAEPTNHTADDNLKHASYYCYTLVTVWPSDSLLVHAAAWAQGTDWGHQLAISRLLPPEVSCIWWGQSWLGSCLGGGSRWCYLSNENLQGWQADTTACVAWATQKLPWCHSGNAKFPHVGPLSSCEFVPLLILELEGSWMTSAVAGFFQLWPSLYWNWDSASHKHGCSQQGLRVLGFRVYLNPKYISMTVAGKLPFLELASREALHHGLGRLPIWICALTAVYFLHHVYHFVRQSWHISTSCFACNCMRCSDHTIIVQACRMYTSAPCAMSPFSASWLAHMQCCHDLV